MANTNLLDTKTLTLNEILGNGKIYRVPQFQRDYSWEEDHWEDLWNDIINTYTAKPKKHILWVLSFCKLKGMKVIRSFGLLTDNKDLPH